MSIKVYKSDFKLCWASAAFSQSIFLTLLKRKCFEGDNSATQLEMNMPSGQTPPSVQPPFNSSFQQWVFRQSHLSWCNSGKIRRNNCLQSRSHASYHCFLPLKVKGKNTLLRQIWLKNNNNKKTINNYKKCFLHLCKQWNFPKYLLSFWKMWSLRHCSCSTLN